MTSKQTKEELLKEKEILQMALKIMDRYNVLDSKLAINTAKYLYESNIKSDKFSKDYYHGYFDLDEIVEYVLIKKRKEEKIINLSEKKLKYQKNEFFPNESKYQNESAIIISFPKSKVNNINNKQRIKKKEEQKCQNYQK